MSSALITVAPKLSKLIRLLASKNDGEVLGTVAAIRRTLERAGLDLHDLAKVLGRAEQPDASPPLAWRDLPESEQAGQLKAMRVSHLLTSWERDFASSILEQVREWPRRTLSEKQLAVLDRLVRKIAEARR